MEEPLVSTCNPRFQDPAEAPSKQSNSCLDEEGYLGEDLPTGVTSSSSATAAAAGTVNNRDDQIHVPYSDKREREEVSSGPPSPKIRKTEDSVNPAESDPPLKIELPQSTEIKTEPTAESGPSVPPEVEKNETPTIQKPRSRGGFDQPNSNEVICTKTEEYANRVVQQELGKQEVANNPTAEEEKKEVKKKRKSKWDLVTPSEEGGLTSSDLMSTGLSRSGFSDAPSLPLGPSVTQPSSDAQGTQLASALSSAIVNAQQKHGVVGVEARRASRLQIGNLPSGVSESEIVMFFNAALVSVGGAQLNNTDPSKLPVLCSEMFNVTTKTCVLQYRQQNDAQTCLTLNGIAYNGCPLTITSIPDYLDIDGTFEEDHRIFLQNLALDMTEKQVQALLEQFGPVKTCTMAHDASGLSKGIGIVEFEDPAVTDVAIQALNGFTVGNRVLMVRRASSVGINLLAPGSVPVQRSTFVSQLPTSMSHRLFSNFIVAQQVRKARKYGDIHSSVVQLLNCVFREDLLDETNYSEILEDLKTEASKFGQLKQIVIPRPNKDLSHGPGVGKVFFHYEDVTAARKAKQELNGRKFDRRTVCAAFYPEDRFLSGLYTFLTTNDE